MKITIFLVLSMTAVSLADETTAPRGQPCDLVTGSVVCEHSCQTMGFDNGYCQQSRLTCHCYYDRLPHELQPRPHPIDEDISGYAEFYERDNNKTNY
jgi:hypothetical protein